MATQALLDECADMILRTGTADVPCCRFSMTSTCATIKAVFEECGLDAAEGKVVFPCPGANPAHVKAAVDMIHGIRSPEDLCTMDDLEAAKNGLDFLGCDMFTDDLVERLWTLVCREPLAKIVPHMNSILRCDRTKFEACKRLVELRPTWMAFKNDVLGILGIIDIELADFLVGRLLRFFPAELVVGDMLRRLAPASLSPQTVFKLVGAYGTYYHPAEVYVVFKNAVEILESKDDAQAKIMTGLMRTVVGGLSVYDVAPMSGIYGSVVAFEDPVVSALLTIERKTGPARRRIAPWLSVDFDWGAGTVDLQLRMNKLDDAKGASTVQVRLLAISTTWVPEVWYEFKPASHLATLTTVGTQHFLGNPDELAVALRGDVRRIRVDVWFGKIPVLPS